MSISVKTRKLLWGKAASRCSFPECKKELIMDETETDDPSIMGEECHIVARENGGPRGNTSLSKEKRDLYSNLVLMCNNHHKVIDDQEKAYTIEVLNDIKKTHEDWVKKSLKIDEFREKDELIYSSYIDTWVKKSDIGNWNIWASGLLSIGQPSLNKDKLHELKDLNNWMFKRIMPKRFNELEKAFENFRLVLQDFITTFESHAVERGETISTEKFYQKLDYWDEERNRELLKEYHFHVDLVQDLILELTRAANLVCDQVRIFILSDFRMAEGLIVVTSGPHDALSFITHKPQYSISERDGRLYHNLNQFKLDRQNRDFCFGVGSNVKESEDMGVTY